MYQRFKLLWVAAISRYWVLPLALSLSAIALGGLTLAVDQQWDYGHSPTLSISGAQATSALALIANSMITVMGVVLSITVVALTLASAQYGPRLLRTFMTDLGTQVVVGLYSGTFLYALLMLRFVDEGQSLAEVPQISVATAHILALLSLGALVYFIHHVSVLIQANHVAAVVARDLEDSIIRTFPSRKPRRIARPTNTAAVDSELPEGRFARVRAENTGYIDTIGYDGLMRLACKHDLLIRLLRRPGDLIYAGDCLVRIWPQERVPRKVKSQVRRQFKISDRRTPQQDLECGINELTEVAVRALSHSINDPTTAIACIDRLGAALMLLVARRLPDRFYRDSQHQLRIIIRPFSVRSAIDAGFDEIRQYAAESVSVHVRLLETIQRIGRRVRRRSDALALLRHAHMIYCSGKNLPERRDRQDVKNRFDRCRRTIERRIAGQNQPVAGTDPVSERETGAEA